MDDIKEQFDRIKRWYSRLKNLEDIKKFPTKEESLHVRNEYLDIAYAFFMNCYHMSDWIAKNRTGIKTMEDPFLYAKNSNYIKFSYDICIASKHLKINRAIVDKDISLERVFHQGAGSAKKSIRNMEYVAKYKDCLGNIHSMKLIDIATNCISEWERFFKDEGIKV